ncbi:hypothetical protein EHQ58_17850 [Leptospira ognonensis]|uniref:Uncharacterized protein n=1 Tax=Leptospira ognonensis TaxID=2484945 RepID=A0A4R9JUK5_9LEPT|nr:hypothetical protein [Leptospira ognonensis]TGL56482.1 hypothetical protein EHQ58_17850 [Leptospira ognonensis]
MNTWKRIPFFAFILWLPFCFSPLTSQEVKKTDTTRVTQEIQNQYFAVFESLDLEEEADLHVFFAKHEFHLFSPLFLSGNDFLSSADKHSSFHLPFFYTNLPPPIA